MTHTLLQPAAPARRSVGRSPVSPPLPERRGHRAARQNAVHMLWCRAGWQPCSPEGPAPRVDGRGARSVVIRGLRAHRRVDGSVALLRPYTHAEHFAARCAGAGIPPVPTDAFVEAARLLSRRHRHELPEPPGSLHLVAVVEVAREAGRHDGVHFRMEAATENDGVGLTPVRLTVDGHCMGTGPGVPHPFFVTGPAASSRVFTPPIHRGPVVARDTVLRLAMALGLWCRESAGSVEDWHAAARSGHVSEAFACSDAALVTPVSAVEAPQGSWRIGDGQPGAAAIAVRRATTRLVRGEMRDEEGWLDVLR